MANCAGDNTFSDKVFGKLSAEIQHKNLIFPVADLSSIFTIEELYFFYLIL